MAQMKDEIFAELAASVREGGAILRGEKSASRAFRYEALDVHSIRTRMGLSQSRFALLLGISVRTLQNWEQGRRQPRGAAQVLLQIAARHPEIVLEVVWDAVSRE